MIDFPLRRSKPLVTFRESPQEEPPEKLKVNNAAQIFRPRGKKTAFHLHNLTILLQSENLFSPDAKAPVIDCTANGFFKVLGNGALPKIPVIVKARFFSKLAEKKINEAGGVCVLTA